MLRRLLRAWLRLWPNKTRWDMSLLALQLGGGGAFVLYQFLRRLAHVGMDASAWVLLVGGVVMFLLLAWAWQDYRSTQGTKQALNR